jgi:hypothetical protein
LFSKTIFFLLAEAAASSASSSSSSPKWHFELRRWRHTYYSLSFDIDANEETNNVHDGDDDDEEEGDGTLDVMIFFNYHSGICFSIQFSLSKIYSYR